MPNRVIRSDGRPLRGYERELRGKAWQGDGQLLTVRRTLGAARRPCLVTYLRATERLSQSSKRVGPTRGLSPGVSD
jgi:hypothetical protein